MLSIIFVKFKHIDFPSSLFKGGWVKSYYNLKNDPPLQCKYTSVHTTNNNV